MSRSEAQKRFRRAALVGSALLPIGLGGSGGIGLLIVASVGLKQVRKRDLLRGPALALLAYGVVDLVATARSSPSLAHLVAAGFSAPVLATGFVAGLALSRAGLRLAACMWIAVGGILASLWTVVAAVVVSGHVAGGPFIYGYLHNYTGTVAALVACCGLYLADSGDRAYARVGALTAIMAFVATVAALSWVGAAGIACAALVYVVVARRRLVTLALTVVLLLSVGAFWLVVAPRSGLEPIAHRSMILGPSTSGSVVEGRLAIFGDGVRMAGSRLLSGWGVGGMRRAYGEFPTGTYRDFQLSHFHNWFIQAFFEGGVPLLAVLLAVFFAIGRELARAEQGVRALGAAAVVALLATQLVDYVIPQLCIGFLAMALVGLAARPDIEGAQTYGASWLRGWLASTIGLVGVGLFVPLSAWAPAAPRPVVHVLGTDADLMWSESSALDHSGVPFIATLYAEASPIRVLLQTCDSQTCSRFGERVLARSGLSTLILQNGQRASTACAIRMFFYRSDGVFARASSYYVVRDPKGRAVADCAVDSR